MEFPIDRLTADQLAEEVRNQSENYGDSLAELVRRSDKHDRIGRVMRLSTAEVTSALKELGDASEFLSRLRREMERWFPSEEG